MNYLQNLDSIEIGSRKIVAGLVIGVYIGL